jgi:DNA polymerase
VGNPEADLMFIGEGPGRDEDLQGEPFVGAAGQLLNRIIRAMGLRREEVYIANVVKCRPPENRDPEADEVATCSSFLFQQIASIRPKVIVGLGRPACATLLGAPLTTSITKIRGRWLEFRGQIPMMPTFHPAYLLRNEAAKREVWEDMKQVVAELEKRTGRKLEVATGKGGRP